MKTILDDEEIDAIALKVADAVIKKIKMSDSRFIRTKDIPKTYGVCKSYSEQLVREMRESGKYAGSFICDGRVILVDRNTFEVFWRERGKSK